MEKPNKSNHYAVVKFSPKQNTDTTIFLFEHGRFFSDEDMSDYILWFMEHQGLSIDDVKLRVSYEECRGILDRDQYVDWNNVSRPYSNTWQQQVLSTRLITSRKLAMSHHNDVDT